MHAEEISVTPPGLGGRAIMRQRWTEASFIHWRVSPEVVAPFMPQGCRPDIVDGSAWVGLIAFQMSKSAFFGGPSVPWLGDFPEVNVRLYSVDEHGRRGVVFLSLEASHVIPVLVARAAFGLKYQWASMRITQDDGLVRYTTKRILNKNASSVIEVRPGTDPEADAALHSDPIAQALTARWAFHERHVGKTLYCRNTHEPWPLQTAELVHLDDQLLRVAGFGDLASRTPDSVMYSAGVTTFFGAPSSL